LKVASDEKREMMTIKKREGVRKVETISLKGGIALSKRKGGNAVEKRPA